MRRRLARAVKKLFREARFTSVEGSAFAKVVAQDEMLANVKSAIIALRASETVSNLVLGELEIAAAEVHAGRESIQNRLDKLNASLGI